MTLACESQRLRPITGSYQPPLPPFGAQQDLIDNLIHGTTLGVDDNTEVVEISLDRVPTRTHPVPKRLATVARSLPKSYYLKWRPQRKEVYGSIRDVRATKVIVAPWRLKNVLEDN